jgi:hypothetical protein
VPLISVAIEPGDPAGAQLSEAASTLKHESVGRLSSSTGSLCVRPCLTELAPDGCGAGGGLVWRGSSPRTLGG